VVTYYLDSGFFLTPLLNKREQSVIDKCAAWMMRVQYQEIAACTSWLTWDEVTWIAGRPSKGCPFDVRRAATAGQLLMELAGLAFLPVDEMVIRKAQELLTSSSCLRPRDSIHASSALKSAGGNLVTLDADFEKDGRLLGAFGIQVHLIR